MLSKSPLSLENTKFITNQLTYTVSFNIITLDKGKNKRKKIQ